MKNDLHMAVDWQIEQISQYLKRFTIVVY